MSKLLNERVAIITGGASGIGLASVHAFVREGAKVAIADVADEAGERLAEELGDDAIYVHTDVTDESALESLVARTVGHFGRLDVMFNNAGAQGDPAPLLEVTGAGFERTISLLATSVLLGHRFAGAQFQRQGSHGSIITTLSVAGLQGAWATTGYTVSKHASVGVLRQAVAELGPLGIRSNGIAPGIIMTPAMAKTLGAPPEEVDGFLDFIGARVGGETPLGRVGLPEDIADVALFLASDMSRFMTGAIIPVDGGATSINQSGIAAAMFAAAEEYRAR